MRQTRDTACDRTRARPDEENSFHLCGRSLIMLPAVCATANKGGHDHPVDYFLAGTAGQAEDALGRIQRIDDLLRRWRDQLTKLPSRLPEKAIELFAENPFWTVSKLATRLDVAFTTAQRAIDRLESAGIVALASEAKRNRVYCARAILEILEEPARLETGRTARPRGVRT